MLPAPSIPSLGQGQPTPKTHGAHPASGKFTAQGTPGRCSRRWRGARRPGSQAQGHPAGAAGRRERACGQRLSRIQELPCGPRRPSPVLPAARERAGPTVPQSPGLREPGPRRGGSQDPGPTPPRRPFPGPAGTAGNAAHLTPPRLGPPGPPRYGQSRGTSADGPGCADPDPAALTR